VIRYLTLVTRRLATSFAVCDLAGRLGFPTIVTPLQLFGLMVFFGMILAEFIFDYEFQEYLDREQAAREETRFLPLMRLIAVGISYGVARLVIWAAS
jgi:hypothetical protein